MTNPFLDYLICNISYIQLSKMLLVFVGYIFSNIYSIIIFQWQSKPVRPVHGPRMDMYTIVLSSIISLLFVSSTIIVFVMRS